MTNDYNALIIRAERLIKGDIVQRHGVAYRVRLAEKTSLTRVRLVLEPVEASTPDLRLIIERDLVFLVLLLV